MQPQNLTKSTQPTSILPECLNIWMIRIYTTTWRIMLFSLRSIYRKSLLNIIIGAWLSWLVGSLKRPSGFWMELKGCSGLRKVQILFMRMITWSCWLWLAIIWDVTINEGSSQMLLWGIWTMLWTLSCSVTSQDHILQARSWTYAQFYHRWKDIVRLESMLHLPSQIFWMSSGWSDWS